MKTLIMVVMIALIMFVSMFAFMIFWTWWSGLSVWNYFPFEIDLWMIPCFIIFVGLCSAWVEKKTIKIDK